MARRELDIDKVISETMDAEREWLDNLMDQWPQREDKNNWIIDDPNE